MSFGLPDKPRDEDYGVNDDAGEWSKPYLDALGDKPVTMESFLEFYDAQDDLYGDAEVTVAEVLRRMKEARK